MKFTKEKFKTYKDVFDEFTVQTLLKLITEGHFDGVIGPVSIGKESNVFQVRRKDGSIAIAKVYRLETCDFNRMFDYIKTDPRFSDIKKKRRKVIFAWCQREYRNLLKARQAGVAVPTPYTFKNNVLVEECVGGNAPAPKLKDKVPENLDAFFKEIIHNYHLLYRKAGLVHADLSHFNILNDHGHPVFIDLSTATPIDDLSAQRYLERDITIITKHFLKLGLDVSLENAMQKIKKGARLS